METAGWHGRESPAFAQDVLPRKRHVHISPMLVDVRVCVCVCVCVCVYLREPKVRNGPCWQLRPSHFPFTIFAQSVSFQVKTALTGMAKGDDGRKGKFEILCKLQTTVSIEKITRNFVGKKIKWKILYKYFGTPKVPGKTNSMLGDYSLRHALPANFECIMMIVRMSCHFDSHN